MAIGRVLGFLILPEIPNCAEVTALMFKLTSSNSPKRAETSTLSAGKSLIFNVTGFHSNMPASSASTHIPTSNRRAEDERETNASSVNRPG